MKSSLKNLKKITNNKFLKIEIIININIRILDTLLDNYIAKK